jgi:hypothetical protein
MRDFPFSLIPFPSPWNPNIQLTGKISRENNILSVHYALTGACENILFPTVSRHPRRRHDLWKSSCFEFFLALPNRPEYWEFNMSPSGDWNVYHMDAYRRVGFREERLFRELHFSIQRERNSILVDTAVDLDPMIPAEETLLVGITSVIQTIDGHETYWALVHPGLQADFHWRESFMLQL